MNKGVFSNQKKKNYFPYSFFFSNDKKWKMYSIDENDKQFFSIEKKKKKYIKIITIFHKKIS
jgi:hypothetical protein